MPRKVTATLPDGRTVVYNNVPYSVTPAAMTARIQKDYGVAARSIDGGGTPAPGSADAYEARWSHISPVQAKALLTQYGNNAGAGAPQTQALMRIAGMTSLPKPSAPAAPTRAQRIAAAGQSTVADSKARGEGDFGQAMLAGIERATGFGIPERIAAGLERVLPASITGNTTNASYQDILDTIRARTDAQASRSGAGNFIGSVLGGGLTGSAAAKAVGAAAGVASRVAPAVATPVANVLARVAAAAPKTSAAARVVASGAAGGAAQAAGQGSDIGEGAKEGAEGAAVLGVGAKAGAALLRPAADFLQLNGAANVLRRYTSETAESLKAKADDFFQRTGTQPTVYELLGAGDRQGLKKAIGLMPDDARENLASNVRDRAASIGTDQAARTATIVQPQLDTHAATIAQNLADSRVAHIDGAVATPTADETALANQAVRNPLDMETAMQQRASNFMAPHDDRTLYGNVDALRPQTPELTDNGVQMVDADPAVSHMILTVAGSARRRPDGITGSDVSSIMSKLRKIQGKGGTEGATATNALDHLTGLVGEDHPDFAAANQRMTDGYAADNRFLEGMQEGTATRLRADAPATRAARNAYDTPEGAAGRAAGQAAELERGVTGTPAQALSATKEIAGAPRTQAAISQNLGNDAGAQIADSANGVSESARRLAGLSTESSGTDGADLTTVMHGLMALNPATLPHTKAFALSKLASLGVKLPEKASNDIVDSLFSQNPTQIARAMTFLNNAGDAGKAVLGSIASGIGQGAATTALSQPAPADPNASAPPATPQETAIPGVDPTAIPGAPAPAAPADNDATDDSGPPSSVGEADPVASSPYLPNLKNLYATENPAALDFYDRIAQQESGGKHFGSDGKPKVSSAGAIGLMQVEPGTLPQAAKEAGLPVDMAALQNDPAYNRLVGSAHLGKLLAHYDGDPAKAAAAYNAGQGRVDRELGKGGDWLSRLPAETQNYVQAVS